ncbi:Hvo_1808 family surface protein [Haloplanus sp. C73]|uniref:Hvo_1808 family surface protein n=1 Tax=Haloplanus sp. C73 TaxID=3421641 RepID=UPI003EB853FE
MRQRVSVGLAVLIVLASVAPAALAGGASAAVDDGDTVQQQADPDTDTIGWEGGYWHNESIDINQSDGLSDTEMDALVSRGMARVEYLRGAEFESDVPVEVISREEFQSRQSGNATSNASYDAWNSQVWEALFVVGESDGANDAIQSATGQSTAGFYAPGDDRIRIITDSPDSPTIDNATLIHELVHALQDQRGNLGERISSAETQDADLATDGVVEGEANYIEQQYTQRCGVEWECAEAPSSGGGSGTQAPPNLGILLTLLHPYSDGPVYIDWLREQGGWDAVDAAFEDPPTSTEQIIHLTDEEPVPIEYEDRARGGWETYPNQGVNGSDTVGEASMYVMFWYQARTERAQTISPRSVGQTTSPFDTYNYDSEPSAGWGNDRLYPYHEGTGEDARHGYVWVTEWDSEQDAAQFHNTYRAILNAHDATSEGANTYVIESGEFADAFRIDRQGTRVTIVNGPTTDALADIRPRTQSDTDGGSDSMNSTTESEATETGSTGLEAPGFGALTALVAVLATIALAVAVRRRA